MGVLPPLGLIGFASPLTASGFLFPGWSWAGLALSMVGCCLIAACPKYGIPGTTAVALVANLLFSGARQPPSDWEAVDTQFGAISHGPLHPLREYLVACNIQAHAAASPARVVVFPESVVPKWTASTDLFWNPTIEALRRQGRIVLIGALVPESLSVRSADLRAAIDVLRTTHEAEAEPVPRQAAPYYYRNVAIIRGAQSGTFFQRVPVPVSVWRPFSRGGAPLHLAGPPVIDVAGQRAAVLICYEQVIPWPVLTAAVARPTLFVGMSNDHWAARTTIPQWQKVCLAAWSRLFRIPYLLAVNT
jgi:apolipoprotein N-acyltransferase